MLDGYHRNFNRWGWQQVNQLADIPDPALGVGFAERLSDTKLRIIYEPVQQGADLKKIVTLDDASVKGQGTQVAATQFPSSGWMGDMLGVF